MRILHVIYTHGVGGAEKYLKHLLPGLKGYGIDCDLIVVCTKETEGIFSAYCDTLNSLGVRTTLMVAEKYSILKTSKNVNTYLKAEGINILHTHLFHADLMAAVLKTFFNKRVHIISTKHGYQEKFLQQYEPGKRYSPKDFYYFLTKFILSKVDSNVAVSKGIADLYVNLGLAKTAYPVIHHGINIKEYNKEDYKSECKLANPQLVIVGRIELFKGHQFLIEAMPAVVTAFPEIKLLILGKGSEKNNRIKQVNELALQNNVEFLGFKDHPYAFISHSDIIILPSLFEPFGLVYIEAFALKTPVIAFDTPAGNEIMENNETGLMVNKADTTALAEKIIYLLNNKAIGEAIAERAYKKYQEFFTTDIMIKNTADWYFKTGL